MPKGKLIVGDTRKMKIVQRKFKLGGRTNTVGALTLSTPELLKKFEEPLRKRDRNKIQQVLQARGVMVGGKNVFELVADSAAVNEGNDGGG